MADAIWKDKIVSLGTTADTEFRVQFGGNTIYQGKAFIRPGDSAPSVRLNDICADYLRATFPTLTNKGFALASNVGTFTLQRKSGTSWASVGSYDFYGDWSYEPNYNMGTTGWSSPIINRIDERQWLLYSAMNKSLNFKSTNKRGTTYTDAVSGSSGNNGTAMLNLSLRSDIVRVVVNGYTFYVSPSCHRYCLYYLNAYGGWDTFLIEGDVLERDTFVRHNAELEYNNTDPLQRGRRNYVNEVVKGFTMHTGWLSDWESSRMYHLLGSVDVYLHDLALGDIRGVVLTNNSAEYRTFKNNGRKLVEYTIECELAQGRDRR